MHNRLQNPPSQNLPIPSNPESSLDQTCAIWSVYMIETEQQTLYTGIATDIHRRFEEHLQTHLGKSRLGAKYFRGRRPMKIVYHEVCDSHSAAASREYAIKKLSANTKRRLIEGVLAT